MRARPRAARRPARVRPCTRSNVEPAGSTPPSARGTGGAHDLDARLTRAERIGHDVRWLPAAPAAGAGRAPTVAPVWPTTAQRSPGEGVAPAELATTLAHRTDAVAQQRLHGGAGAAAAVRALKPHQPAIEAAAGRLGTATRRRLVFLYAVCWNQAGADWASRTFAGDGAYTRAYELQLTIREVDRLRHDLATGQAPKPTLASFVGEHRRRLADLPPIYRELLTGYLAALPAAERPESGLEIPAAGPAARALARTADADRRRFRVHAAVRAHGMSAKAGATVAAEVRAAPSAFRDLSPQQRVDLVAAARAAGATDVVELLASLAPAAFRSRLRDLAEDARQLHWDLDRWALAGIDGGTPEGALQQVAALRGKANWKPDRALRYGAVEDRRKLVYAIQARMQRTPIPASTETTRRRALADLRGAREELFDGADDRDAAELRAASRRAITETPLPELTLAEATGAELAGSVGLDTEVGREIGKKIGNLPKLIAQIKDKASERLVYFQKVFRLLIDDPLKYLRGALKDVLSALIEPSTLAQIALFMAIILVTNVILPGAGAGVSAFLVKALFGAVGIVQTLEALLGDLIGLVTAKDPETGARKVAQLMIRGLIGLLILIGIRGLGKLTSKLGKIKPRSKTRTPAKKTRWKQKLPPRNLSAALEKSRTLGELKQLPGSVDQVGKVVTGVPARLRRGALGGVIALGEAVDQRGYDLVPGLDAAADKLRAGKAAKPKKKVKGLRRVLAALRRLALLAVNAAVRIKDWVVVGIQILTWVVHRVYRLAAKALGALKKARGLFGRLVKALIGLPAKIRDAVSSRLKRLTGIASAYVVGRLLHSVMPGKSTKAAWKALELAGARPWLENKAAELATPLHQAADERIGGAVRQVEKTVAPVRDRVVGKAQGALGHPVLEKLDPALSGQELLEAVPIGSDLFEYQLATEGSEGFEQIALRHRVRGTLKSNLKQDSELTGPFDSGAWQRAYARWSPRGRRRSAADTLQDLVATGRVRWVGPNRYLAHWGEMPATELLRRQEGWGQALLATIAESGALSVVVRSDSQGMRLQRVGRVGEELASALYGLSRAAQGSRTLPSELLERGSVEQTLRSGNRRRGGRFSSLNRFDGMAVLTAIAALPQMRSGATTLVYRPVQEQGLGISQQIFEPQKGTFEHRSYSTPRYRIDLSRGQIAIIVRMRLVGFDRSAENAAESPALAAEPVDAEDLKDLTIDDPAGSLAAIPMELERPTYAQATDTWRRGIYDRWNEAFALHNGERTVPIRVKVIFTDQNPDHAVTVRDRLAGTGRESVLNWFFDTTGRDAAHEFGHMIGAYDEYWLSWSDYRATTGSTIGKVERYRRKKKKRMVKHRGKRRWKKRPKVEVVSTKDSLMGEGQNVKNRHFKHIVKWINSNRGVDEPRYRLIRKTW